MSLELTKYCLAFTPRLNDDNIEYYSKWCIGRKIQQCNKIFNPGLALITLSGTGARNISGLCDCVAGKNTIRHEKLKP